MTGPASRHSFSRSAEIYAENPTLSAVVVGHLLVEAILADLIRTSGSAKPASMFAAKVDQAKSLGLLSTSEASALRDFNSIRNRFAHQLDYTLEFEVAYQLVAALGDSGFDFSDETIHSDPTLAADWYGVEGCLTESVSSMFELLAWRTVEHGGPDRLA